MLIARHQERGQRAVELRPRWNPRQAQRGGGGIVQLHGRSTDGPARVADAELVQHPIRKRVLVRGGQRPRARALRAQRSGRDAASVGEWRRRQEGLAEVRHARECPVASLGQPLVDAAAELILIDRFVGDPAIVVRRPAACGARVSVEKFPRNRVPPIRGDRVAREGAARKHAASRTHRRRRVVDRRHTAANWLREDSLALEGGGHGGDHRPGDGLPLALVVPEEEGAIRAHRPAQHATELLTPERRFVAACLGEVVPGVQGLVTQELERRPMKGVRASLRGEVHDAAVEPSELGGWTVGLDLEFLDGVDVRKERHLAGLRLEDGHTVEEVFVRPRAPAVDARQRRAGWQCDAGHEARERDEAAAVQREVDDLARVDDLPEGRSRAAEQGSIGGDRHYFRHAAHPERENRHGWSRRSPTRCRCGATGGTRWPPRGPRRGPAAGPGR